MKHSDLQKLTNKSFDEVMASSELTLILLRLIRGYWHEDRPRPCAVTLKKYYLKLKKMEQNIDNEKKTFKLKKDSIVHISKLQKHVSQDSLTEKEAFEYLEKGYLKAVHFDVLPAKKKTEPEIKPKTEPEIKPKAETGTKPKAETGTKAKAETKKKLNK